MQTETRLAKKLAALLPHLDERARRLVAAAEAMALQRGGASSVRRCCGMSRTTIIAGMRELREGIVRAQGVMRKGSHRNKQQSSGKQCGSRVVWGHDKTLESGY